MIFVDREQLRAVVPMENAIAAISAAFVGVSRGVYEQPPRQALGDGSTLSMMARGPEPEAGTIVKVVSVKPANRGIALPTIHALAIWLDGRTGVPELIVDGSAVTALRTGAASGVATQILAAPTASVLAVIGAGGQAADQVRAVCTVRPIAEVRLTSLSGGTAAELARRLTREMPSITFRPVETVAEAVEGADVVCSATNAAEPVLRAEHLEGRVHLNAIGSYRPGMREFAQDVLQRASLVAIDELEAARTEAGEIIEALASRALPETALVELGTLVIEPPADVRGLTVFKSVGIAAQDWAIAKILRARLPAADGDSRGDVFAAAVE